MEFIKCDIIYLGDNMKRIKISLVLNILIVILVTLATVFMFTGFKFMPSNDLLKATSIEMFKFFTVDSNILVGISSLVLLTYEIKYLNKKIKKIPNSVYLFKLMGTASLCLTFITTAVFLTPQYGFYPMYNNANLLYHLIIPIFTIVSYIFYEKHNVKYRHAFLGIIPMVIYSVYYVSMILIHLNSGGLTYKYDFYGFLRGNIHNTWIVIPVIYIITYLMALLLIYFNKKGKKD